MDDFADTIGMFGTCGGSRWRDGFVAAYDEARIPWFNPQVDDWKPELAAVEAEHLVRDGIVLFPVTSETAGLGSLAETGFSMFQAMKSDMNRFFVFMIDAGCDPEKVTDPALRQESIRARALVRAHLSRNPHPNVFVCEDMDTMLAVSLRLHASLRLVHQARGLLRR